MTIREWAYMFLAAAVGAFAKGWNTLALAWLGMGMSLLLSSHMGETK